MEHEINLLILPFHTFGYNKFGLALPTSRNKDPQAILGDIEENGRATITAIKTLPESNKLNLKKKILALVTAVRTSNKKRTVVLINPSNLVEILIFLHVSPMRYGTIKFV